MEHMATMFSNRNQGMGYWKMIENYFVSLVFWMSIYLFFKSQKILFFVLKGFSSNSNSKLIEFQFILFFMFLCSCYKEAFVALSPTYLVFLKRHKWTKNVNNCVIILFEPNLWKNQIKKSKLNRLYMDMNEAFSLHVNVRKRFPRTACS